MSNTNILKKCTGTANEFLFHKCRNDRKIGKKSHLKKFTSPANDFLLHKCRNNRKKKICVKGKSTGMCRFLLTKNLYIENQRA